MKRLTIKELAPYLPYGLTVRNGVDYTLIGIMPYRTFNKYNGEDEFRLIVKSEDNAMDEFPLSDQCSILLRPLSQLTEERRSGKYNTDITKIVNECEQHCDAYNEWLDIFIDDPDPSRILQAPYEIVQELLAQKYDVFNLIPQGLALPIDGKEVETITCGYCNSEFSKGTGGNYGEYGEVCINCYEGLS